VEAGLRVRASPLTDTGPPDLQFHGPPSRGRAVLVLPGYGDRPELVSSRLDLIDPDGDWFVAVAAPVAEGPDGPMWYLVDEDGPHLAGLARAVASVSVGLDVVAAEAGVERSEVVLVGYSQGGALALATALDPSSGPPPPAAAMLAGYLVNRDDGDLAFERVAGRPVLVGHGADDHVVETMRGRSAAKVLHRKGALVTWSEVVGGHRFGPDLLGPLRTWLAALAAGATPHDPPG
jgi:predicted esterase